MMRTLHGRREFQWRLQLVQPGIRGPGHSRSRVRSRAFHLCPHMRSVMYLSDQLGVPVAHAVYAQTIHLFDIVGSFVIRAVTVEPELETKRRGRFKGARTGNVSQRSGEQGQAMFPSGAEPVGRQNLGLEGEKDRQYFRVGDQTERCGVSGGCPAALRALKALKVTELKPPTPADGEYTVVW
jgi:hypothetical protein